MRQFCLKLVGSGTGQLFHKVPDPVEANGSIIMPV